MERILKSSTTNTLIRERIRPELEAHYLGQSAFAGLEVKHSSSGVGRPNGLSLPAGIGVVDASVHPLGEIADRVRDAQGDELAVDESQQRVVEVAGRDRNIFAQTESVKLIDPGVIARLGAAGLQIGREPCRGRA